MTPQDHAAAVLGPVQWESPVLGYCRCPGESLHTTRTNPKGCRVTLDGAPTVFCFHTHCRGAVEKANFDLRIRLSGGGGTLIFPGGSKITPGGQNTAQPPAIAPVWGQTAEIVPFPNQKTSAYTENALREAIRAKKERILARNRWLFDEICSSSPSNLQEYAPEDYFRRFLLLWKPGDVIWIGNVYDSGSLSAASHFRTVQEWLQIGPVMGNFTCPSVFRPGCTSRADKEALERRYLVVESDTLSKDEVGAVFRWLSKDLRLTLHCIVDTAGKSLHGWFSVPPPEKEPSLKVALGELGCDVKLFNRTQPVRLPGAWRDQKLQTLIWFKA
jgi:hypothetical protein